MLWRKAREKIGDAESTQINAMLIAAKNPKEVPALSRVEWT